MTLKRLSRLIAFFVIGYLGFLVGFVVFRVVVLMVSGWFGVNIIPTTWLFYINFPFLHYVSYALTCKATWLGFLALLGLLARRTPEVRQNTTTP